MSRVFGHLHKEDIFGDWMLVMVAALVLGLGLALPLVGLAVIIFDLVMVLLPLLIIAGLAIGAYEVVCVYKKSPKVLK